MTARSRAGRPAAARCAKSRPVGVTPPRVGALLCRRRRPTKERT